MHHLEHVLERQGELPPRGDEGVGFGASFGDENLHVEMLVGQ